MLGGTRWGSYIGFGPLFVGDMLLAGAAVHYARGRANSAELFELQHKPARPLAIGLLVIYVTVRFVVGMDISMLALRDFAPYAYAAGGLLAWSAMSRAGEDAKLRTRRLLTWALAFHAAWMVAVSLVPTIPDRMPLLSAAQQLHIFSLRDDVDTALTGVAAAMLLVRLFTVRARRFWVVVGFGACWFGVLSTSSRAGLVAAALVNLMGIMAILWRRERGRRSAKPWLVLWAPFVLAALALIVPMTDAGTRLMGTFSNSPASQLAAGAQGTAQARDRAWQALTDWTMADTGRSLVGVGFGPDIMVESRAGYLLIGSGATEGETTPRSPHNYWIGSLARLGILGSLILWLVVLGFTRQALAARKEWSVDPLRFLLVAIPAAMLPVASLGVVLESPFGAIPFWWCLGAALALPRKGC
jgi:hypothetical protein